MKNQFHLPPEWAPQSAVILTWPHAGNTWKPSLAVVEKSFVNIAKHVADYEKVIINCCSGEHLDHVANLLQDAKTNLARVDFFVIESHDVWARDHGPITIINENKIKILDFIFNGWGNKYPAEKDNLITKKLHSLEGLGKHPLESFDIVLEGGSIEVDGHGTLLTTSRCLLSPERNPQFNQAQIEKRLQELLGINRVLWLNHGYQAGDDTDGHIDTLARFTDPHTICYVSCDDKNDEHYEELTAMANELEQFKTFDGKPYRLVALPSPKAILSEEGDRLPATYANFLIINDAVLMPIYNDPADKIAEKQLQTCFPDRKIIPIDCRYLIEQFGSLHCVTMQLPLGVCE